MSSFSSSDYEYSTCDGEFVDFEYSITDDDYGYCPDEDEDDDDQVLPVGTKVEKKFTVLKEKDLRQLMEDAVSRTSTVLFVSREAATLLLLHYRWSVIVVEEEWFADEGRVRDAVGLLEKPVVSYEFQKSKEIFCCICIENCDVDEMTSADCGHLFCNTCWRGYITTSINDGAGCLRLRCPEPSCAAAVGLNMLFLVSEGEKERYEWYLMRSYVEEKRMIKWCPGKGCDSAVKFEAGGGSYDVNCDCGSGFCWNCNEEAHRPVDCETVAKWNLKNISEEESTTWILANSKPCPKCKKPIEKNHGCMHMTCRPPCGFQFCWLCLGDWNEHGTNSGGYYACNRYEERNKNGLFDEEEKRRKMAKSDLKKYTHHYMRWAANQKSRERALKDLQQLRNVHLENLSNIQGIPVTDLQFIVEAWLQIVECRRVLKWAYAYGYYIPRNVPGRKEFFEYLQGEAETGLERLHQCTEKELQTYLCAEEPSEDFQDFRTKLVGLTSVTRAYFENLVKALENGLEDVDCTREVSCSRDLKFRVYSKK